MEPATPIDEAYYTKVFIDLSDQYEAIRRYLNEKKDDCHATAEYVIQHILDTQFDDMFDRYYLPEKTTDDWRFSALGEKYGTISQLIKDRMVTALESFVNQTRMHQFDPPEIVFHSTFAQGVIVMIGGRRRCVEGR
jgi:hypothetical protein